MIPAQQLRSTSIAAHQATKVVNQRPHIGSTQHSQRRKELFQVKNDIKKEPDVTQEEQDPIFTVTFLVQDEKGKWSIPCKFRSGYCY